MRAVQPALHRHCHARRPAQLHAGRTRELRGQVRMCWRPCTRAPSLCRVAPWRGSALLCDVASRCVASRPLAVIAFPCDAPRDVASVRAQIRRAHSMAPPVPARVRVRSTQHAQHAYAACIYMSSFRNRKASLKLALRTRLRILASWHAIDQLITLIPFTVESLNLFLRDIDISHSCTVAIVH